MKLSLIIREVLNDVAYAAGYLRIVYLRMAGVTIGKNCMISWGAKLDVSGGSIVIGDRCTITYGCIILSHDRSKRRIYSDDLVERFIRRFNLV